MEQEAFEHLLYRIGNAAIRSYPYPHFYIEEIFPDDFYQELLANLPDPSLYVTLSETSAVTKGAYKERFVMGLKESDLNALPFMQSMFWNKFVSRFHSPEWIQALQDKFGSFIKDRFGDTRISFSSDLSFIRDRSGYSIGPHTDHPSRVLTLLFYCPTSSAQKHLGTSVYRPRDPAFSCVGLKHHRGDDFIKIHTVPFVPNAVFGFVKSDRSFHGVEPVGPLKEDRSLINYFLIGLPK